MSNNKHQEASALSATQLIKRYQDKPVLDGLNLQIEPGALFALLGPNGAGKSTLIGILSGLYPPDAGDIRVLGFDPLKSSLDVKRRIGIVPEELALFERLTGMQQLLFCGRMYGLSSAESKKRAAELLELTDLHRAESRVIANYSKGMRRRLAIATALIHGPQLVFLDEPFDGIDVLAARVIRELLEELRRKQVTILLTTHILEVADRLATHAGVLYQGTLQDQGEKAALLARYGCENLEGVFQALVPVADVPEASLSFYQENSGS